MRETLGANFSKSPLAAQALVHAGFSERLLGENMCVGIIDGGPAEARGKLFHARRSGVHRRPSRLQLRPAMSHSSVRRAPAALRFACGSTTGPVQRRTRACVPTGFVYQRDLLESGAGAVQPRLLGKRQSAESLAFGGRNVLRIVLHDDRRILARRGRRILLFLAEPLKRSVVFPDEVRQDVVADESGERARDEAHHRGITAQVGRLAGSACRDQCDCGRVSAFRRGRHRMLPKRGPRLAASAESSCGSRARRLGDLYRWQTGKVPGTFDDMTGRDMCFPVGVSESNDQPQSLAVANRLAMYSRFVTGMSGVS